MGAGLKMDRRYASRGVNLFAKVRPWQRTENISNKSMKKIKNSNGFTLIEVMIAILILSVGMMAMALLQISAIRGGAFANQMTQAAIDGQDKIEELRNTNYSTLAGGQDTVVSGNGMTYTRTWTVTESPPPGTTGPSTFKMKTIHLTISWTGPEGQTHHVEFSTIVFQ